MFQLWRGIYYIQHSRHYHCLFSKTIDMIIGFTLLLSPNTVKSRHNEQGVTNTHSIGIQINANTAKSRFIEP